MRYADVCKAGMSALKKRDRSGRKAKGKAKKKEKKGGNGGGGGMEGEMKG
jgi:signal recognition particle subunit SRP14